MKFVCPSAPNDNRDVVLLVPEVPAVSTSRSFPGFTAHTAAYTVRVAAVLGETQTSELMSLMSSAVSILPKAAYLQKYWNIAS